MDPIKTNATRRVIINLLKWVFSVLFLLMALMALFKDHSFLAFLCFLLAGLLLLPTLSSFRKSKLSFLNNRTVAVFLIFLLVIIGSLNLPKPPDKPINLSEKKEVETNTQSSEVQAANAENDGRRHFDADGNEISPTAKSIQAEEPAGTNIPGIKPVDVYGNFENINFSLEKQISTQGSIFTNRFEENGIEFTAETYCKEGVNDVTTITLTAYRKLPQYNKVGDMKKFLQYGCSVPYDGADVAKAKNFIEENYFNDKASIVISGVKFTIYGKTEFIRMIEIEKYQSL